MPVSSSRGRVVPRGVKRKMSNYDVRPRGPQAIRSRDTAVHIIVRHQPPTPWRLWNSPN